MKYVSFLHVSPPKESKYSTSNHLVNNFWVQMFTGKNTYTRLCWFITFSSFFRQTFLIRRKRLAQRLFSSRDTLRTYRFSSWFSYFDCTFYDYSEVLFFVIICGLRTAATHQIPLLFDIHFASIESPTRITPRVLVFVTLSVNLNFSIRLQRHISNAPRDLFFHFINSVTSQTCIKLYYTAHKSFSKCLGQPNSLFNFTYCNVIMIISYCSVVKTLLLI